MPKATRTRPSREPVARRRKSDFADSEGLPSQPNFQLQIEEYLQGLHPNKLNKALISSKLYSQVLLILADPTSTTHGTAQLRFWAKKMFKLVRCPAADFITHEDRPVAVRERLYEIISDAHEASQHGGRDKTHIELRKSWSWVPKDVIARYVKVCPTCIAKKECMRPTLRAELRRSTPVAPMPVKQQSSDVSTASSSSSIPSAYSYSSDDEYEEYEDPELPTPPAIFFPPSAEQGSLFSPHHSSTASLPPRSLAQPSSSFSPQPTYDAHVLSLFSPSFDSAPAPNTLPPPLPLAFPPSWQLGSTPTTPRTIRRLAQAVTHALEEFPAPSASGSSSSPSTSSCDTSLSTAFSDRSKEGERAMDEALHVREQELLEAQMRELINEGALGVSALQTTQAGSELTGKADELEVDSPSYPGQRLFFSSTPYV
ncbi:hypothetical protein JCM5296_001179 [Sporobolomyces johnsonii]